MSVVINAFYICKYCEGENLGSKKLVQDVNNKNNINDYDDDEDRKNNNLLNLAFC